jgi:hypothetical protein
VTSYLRQAVILTIGFAILAFAVALCIALLFSIISIMSVSLLRYFFLDKQFAIRYIVSCDDKMILRQLCTTVKSYFVLGQKN